VLKLKSLSMRNFRSYGDYDTTMDLDGLGPVLIVGELTEDQRKWSDSNGAGKSTIVDAIVWCLFGRLPNKAAPGDHVVNVGTGKGCSVTLTTMDGHVITRTRKCPNDDLLIRSPDGKDVSDSVNRNAQRHLNAMFGLDYDLFMSSVVFSQKGKSFLEQSDVKRRRAMERMLNVAKYDHYVQVAKEMISSAESAMERARAGTAQQENELLRISAMIEKSHSEKIADDQRRQERIDELRRQLVGLDGKYADERNALLSRIADAEKELAAIPVIDATSLAREWELYEERLKGLRNAREALDQLRHRAETAEATRKALLEHRDRDFGEQATRLQAEHARARRELAGSSTVDVDALEKEWSSYRTATQAIKEAEDGVRKLASERSGIESEIGVHKASVAEAESKRGTTCPECGQEVADGFVTDRKSRHQTEIDASKERIAGLDAEIGRRRGLIEKARSRITDPSITLDAARIKNQTNACLKEAMERAAEAIRHMAEEKRQADAEKADRERKVADLAVESRELADRIRNGTEDLAEAEKRVTATKPGTTMAEAEAVRRQVGAKRGEIGTLKEALTGIEERRVTEARTLEDEIRRTSEEQSPYDKVLARLEADLESVRKSMKEGSFEIARRDDEVKHLTYIAKSYSDRRRIKAFVVKKRIPFLNDRIAYYLKMLRCDFPLEFNDFLQAKTGTYPYELWSGGECRRIDLALMLAIYRLNGVVHGSQCNVLVFDEVEKSLDRSGREAFAELVMREFPDKTVLLVSHTTDLFDAFPRKLVVRRRSRYESYVEELR